jgi:hypothetical protein
LTRELYNGAFSERIGAYRINQISLNYYDQANQLLNVAQIAPSKLFAPDKKLVFSVLSKL